MKVWIEAEGLGGGWRRRRDDAAKAMLNSSVCKLKSRTAVRCLRSACVVFLFMLLIVDGDEREAIVDNRCIVDKFDWQVHGCALYRTS